MADNLDSQEVPLDHQLDAPEHEELLSPPKPVIQPRIEDSPPTIAPSTRIGIPVTSVEPAVFHPESVAATSQLSEPLSGAPVINTPEPIVSSIEPTPKDSRKKLFILLAAIFGGLLLLGGGGAAAYFGYYLPNQPQNVVARAILHEFSGQNKLQSGSLEGELNINGGSVPALLGTTTFNGEFDGNQGFSITANPSISVLKPAVTLLSPDGKSFYFKLSGLSDVGGLLPSLFSSQTTGGNSQVAQYAGIIGPLLNQINGKWYMFDKNSLSGDSSAQNSSLYNPADLNKIGDIYLHHRFIAKGKKLNAETINGTSSTHYQVTLGNKELKDFLNDLKNAHLKSFPITQSNYSDMTTAIDRQDLSKFPLDFWVSKNLNINQFMYNHTDKGMTTLLRLSTSGRGKSIKIEKPADSHPISELLSGLGGPSDGTSGLPKTTNAHDKERLSDMLALQSKITEYWTKSYGDYPTSITKLNDVPVEACRAPGGSGTCTRPDYGYHAYKTGTKPSASTPTDCDGIKVPCKQYILYADKTVSLASAMESITNPYILSSE